MPTVNRLRLISLSDREFRRESNTTAPETLPAPTSFKGLRLNISKYDSSWDRKRGAAARLMGVLLREDDQELAERVCESAESARTYSGAADWLAQEARYLRKLAALLDTAAARLAVVLQRCGHSSATSSN